MNNHWCRTVGQNPCRSVFDFPVQHVIAIFQCGLRVINDIHFWHPQLKVFVCWDRHWWWGRPVPFPIPGLTVSSNRCRVAGRASVESADSEEARMEWVDSPLSPSLGWCSALFHSRQAPGSGWCSIIISWQWVFSNSFVVFSFFFCVQDRITVKP